MLELNIKIFFVVNSFYKNRKGELMMVKLTTVQAKSAVRKYADRQKTIRQLAIEYDVTYEQMRKIMVKAGYSNGLKVR